MVFALDYQRLPKATAPGSDASVPITVGPYGDQNASLVLRDGSLMFHGPQPRIEAIRLAAGEDRLNRALYMRQRYQLMVQLYLLFPSSLACYSRSHNSHVFMPHVCVCACMRVCV